MRIRILLVAAFIYCATQSAKSQSDLLQFSRLDNNNGLSHNQVNCFFKDNTGFIWIGTLSGLNRFDGYSFKVFRNNAQDSSSLPYNEVRKLFQDPHGRVWITTNNGTCAYEPGKETFNRRPDSLLKEFHIPAGNVTNIIKDIKGFYWFILENGDLYRYDTSLRQSFPVVYATEMIDHISDLQEDKDGNFWVVCNNGVLIKLDGKTLHVSYRNVDFGRLYTKETRNYQLSIDHDGDPWVFAGENANCGAYYFDYATLTWHHLTTEAQDWLKLDNNIVRSLAVADNGVIWIGTDHGGLNLVDKSRRVINYVLNDPEDQRSLSQNSINALYKDNDGIMWIGTFKKGIAYYHEKVSKFGLYRHRSSNLRSLPYNDVNSFVEDENGNLWIGTNGGGLIYFNRSKSTFRQYLHDAKDPGSLTTNVIVSLFIDHENKLWIGTYFGGLDCFDGVAFRHYRHNSDDPGSISDDNVWEIEEDNNHNLWIGTLTGSLERLDKFRKVFSHYKIPEGILSAYVPTLMKTRSGEIWAGTGYGLSILKKDGNTFEDIVGDGRAGSLSNNNVLSFHEDFRGNIWVGTQDGLNLYNSETHSFRTFREQDGLPHNTIIDILEDNQHDLWISTPNGLSNMIIRGDPQETDFKPSFINYDDLDGLQGRLFNEGAVCKTRNGELIFGGPNGFNIFNPDEIEINKNLPPVALIDFQIHNNKVGIGRELNGKIVLLKSITETKAITLNYDDNVFSIEFAALSFLHPEKNGYKYSLEGFNNNWVVTNGSSRRVTYTNLDPGNYTFKVIASNSDGRWNNEGAQLAITVLPPFWKTTWAFVIYMVVIFGSLLLARQLILDRERMRFRIAEEHREGQRLHELDMMKIKFFTNVSHEFRTPLSLIITPLEKIMKENRESILADHYKLIHRNAKRLLNLVNQLLDFRKVETEEVKLSLSEGDVVHFVTEAVESFSDLSEKKNIDLAFNTSISSLETFFDQDKLEKILFNLLSNAFKFTHEGGSISVTLHLYNEQSARWLEITVADTGIGIPLTKQEKIFERFFQNDLPGTMVNQGSGIGLSITREFVKIHGGSIRVESEPGKGSCFIVLIPVDSIAHEEVPEAELRHAANPESVGSDTLNGNQTTEMPTLLLVEDNEDFRFYLKDNLKSIYRILEAGDGESGCKTALRMLPDLIVCDIMMPRMTGLEMCRKIRTNAKTSHIPVILLTARSSEEQKMEGYALGANDYVTKPFNFEILLSRIRNLILQKATGHFAANARIDIHASEIEITSLDEKLIEKAIKAVEENLSDPNFSVEELSRKLGMSRVHLYKKLTLLTGKSPIEFIRTIRLQRAAQLLGKSQLTVAEIAYSVGFNNPKYFAKYFKEEFHALPSQYSGKAK